MAGPSGDDIKAERPMDVDGADYAFVPLTPHAIQVSSETAPIGLAGAFRDQRAPSDIRFGIGDVVSITIFEAAAGGLFIPMEASVRPGNYVTLPEQAIDHNGNITVPYGGPVRAAGRTPAQVQAAIVSVLRNRAIEPQAVVHLTQQRSSLVSVIGDVNAPVRFPMPASGANDRVLDAITRAGGIKGQGYETWVVLERQGRRETVPFSNIVFHADNNVYVQPGDSIYVYRDPLTFLAFGASGQQGQFPFGTWRVSLAEAVAKAGGLTDTRADAGSVFLYRREPRNVAAALGVDMARFATPSVPVIYSINLQEPGGYFLATRMEMRNKDVLFVANAPSVQITKFLQYLRVIMATGIDAAVLAHDGGVARETIRTAIR